MIVVSCMNADETEIYDFLKQFPNLFVSAMEVSKRVGHKRRYNNDRTWARPILRRMELDGLLESNPSGEYRLKCGVGEPPPFMIAVGTPGFSLGDTTIIKLEDVESSAKPGAQ